MAKNVISFVKINTAEFLSFSGYLKPHRLVKLMRALCRASVADSWDYDEGNPFTTGDGFFNPKDEYERRLWESMRRQSKEDFLAYIKRRDASGALGALGGRPVPGKPAESEKVLERRVQNTRDRLNNITKMLADKMDPNRNGASLGGSGSVRIGPDFNLRNLKGGFGTFVRRRFEARTLDVASSWLIKNFDGKFCRIGAIIKACCKIEGWDYAMVQSEYLSMCST